MIRSEYSTLISVQMAYFWNRLSLRGEFRFDEFYEWFSHLQIIALFSRRVSRLSIMTPYKVMKLWGSYNTCKHVSSNLKIIALCLYCSINPLI